MPILVVVAWPGAPITADLRHQVQASAAFYAANAMLANLEPARPISRRVPLRPRTISPGPGGSGIVLDGYILDAPGLARPLEADPGLGLSQILDLGLSRLGPDFLSRLNGDFALARYDGRDGSCLLATDIMGQRSLYYAVVDGCLYAASQPSILLGFREVPDTPDPEALAYRLYDLQYLAPERTPYRHIRLLPPGHALVWRDGSATVRPFWSPVPRRSIRFRRDEEYVDAARDLLDRAVDARLPDTGPFLSHLSAGLDSSAVVTSAAQNRDRPFHTITVRPDPTAATPHDPAIYFVDEWPRVQPLLALYPQITGHGVDARLPSLEEEEVGGLFWTRDWPMPSLHRFGWLYPPVWNLARQLGTKIVLSAGLGNVTFSHSGKRVLADAIRQGRIVQALRFLKGPESRRHGLLRTLWHNGVQPLLPYGRHLSRRAMNGQPENPFADFVSVRRDVADRLGLSAIPESQPIRTGSPDLDRQIAGIEEMRVLYATFSFLEQHGDAETRDPTADRELVEFCLAIPRDQYHRNGVNRYLARRMLAGRVPDSITQETRIAPGQPDWFAWATRRRDWIGAELERIEQSPLANEVLDVALMRRVFDDWPATAEEAAKLPRVLLMRHALGHGLRVGQFLARLERRND